MHWTLHLVFLLTPEQNAHSRSQFLWKCDSEKAWKSHLEKEKVRLDAIRSLLSGRRKGTVSNFSFENRAVSLHRCGTPTHTPRQGGARRSARGRRARRTGVDCPAATPAPRGVGARQGVGAAQKAGEGPSLPDFSLMPAAPV